MTDDYFSLIFVQESQTVENTILSSFDSLEVLKLKKKTLPASQFKNLNFLAGGEMSIRYYLHQHFHFILIKVHSIRGIRDSFFPA